MLMYTALFWLNSGGLKVLSSQAQPQPSTKESKDIRL